MEKELTTQQRNKALELLKSHKKERIYVNPVSGHMHFSKRNAVIGNKGKEEGLVEVTAQSKKTSKVEELAEALVATMKSGTASKELEEAFNRKQAEAGKGTKPSANGAGTKEDAGTAFPEGEPSLDWKFDALKAYAAAKQIALEKSDNSKKEVLAKIQAAAEAEKAINDGVEDALEDEELEDGTEA